jgi:eukaryotic-like serine/threonine-protein kinase
MRPRPASGASIMCAFPVSIHPGSRLEDYEVVRPLGGGGMGEIWLARDLTLSRSVALKVLRADLSEDSERVTRFRREACAASALNHPNVCTIHGFGETPEGEQFIAMEHIDGQTLRARMASPIAISETLDTVIQIASALTAAHEAGIIHRDLKPENVMVRPDRLVKVVDFGLAKLADSSASGDATTTGLNTVAGTVFGTVAYMSPEQARGLEVDTRTDIWSLGVILYEMVGGRHPFAGPSSTDSVAAILDREPPPLARFEPAADMELQRIVGKALRKERELRYQSVQDLRLDLLALRESPTRVTAAEGVEHEALRVDAAASRASASSPSIATHALGRVVRLRLRAGVLIVLLALIVTAGWWSSRRASPTIKTPRIVVLPFTTIGSDGGYLADGITEAVTTELGRVGGLQLIASNTAFGHRKAGNREAARTLGVSLVVRGSVQRAGDKVRIDVSLVDADNDTALWSERYNDQVTDLLSMLDQISTRIASTVSERFGTDRGAKSSAVGTRNPEAYDAFLRGLWYLNKTSGQAHVSISGEERRLAVQELERAVEKDPGFALARAALASAYTQRSFYDATDRGFEGKASSQIERALAIDPNLGEAYLARAQLMWTAVNNFPHEAAIADLRRAVSINPNLAQGYIELEKIYYHIGLTQRAVDMHQLAALLDPAQADVTNRGFRALIDAGRLEEVRAGLSRSIPLNPFGRGEALVMMGQLDEARQLLSTSKSIVKGESEYDTASVALLAVIYARLNRRDDAERMIEAVLPEAENSSALSHIHHAQFHLGAALGWLGRHDEAAEWLTKAAQQGYPSYTKFSSDSGLTPLHGHPRFSALLAQLRDDHDRWAKLW